MKVSTCCGAELFNDYGFCPACHEHCGEEECEQEDIEFADQCNKEKFYLLTNQ